MSSLQVGIVGLPNSGKSTLFNTLLKKQVANVASYPFTTIEPNIGVVEVPDERLAKLALIIKPEKVIPAVVKFIDIAGLVKNAHQGEGLGNQFLAKIREVDAVVHIIRAFKDDSVSHYYGSIDPQRDKEIIDLELELGEIKKPTLYVINVDDFDSDNGNDLVINAKTGKGVNELIKKTYELLDLITFYTVKGNKEVTAWSLKKGLTAFVAAEKVHTDMAKGFIKAEVVGFADLIAASSWLGAKSKGKVRLEGRDYLVKDGDVIEFKFNV
ncbi:MAG TPA: DUF933 domain-containing protein [Patescibacteria group bacterium]|nr:DUF933 domain-containing protein [Patescibacteria group bacterium]